MTRLEKTVGCSFRHKNLLLAALTHPSYTNENEPWIPSSSQSFQRLEFLGDSILNFFIATNLYDRFPEANEGLLSRLRSILVSRKLLARIGRSIGLKTHLKLGERERKQPDSLREKIVADAFEALVAAIYFDRGKTAVEKFLRKCFESYFDQKKLFAFDPNPKSVLQEETQKNFFVLPVYRTQQGKNRESFIAWVTIKGRLKTRGQGRTKQEAEAEAAAGLLKKLKAQSKRLIGKKAIKKQASSAKGTVRVS